MNSLGLALILTRTTCFDWNGSGALTAWFFSGLDGTTKGEPLCISSNGFIVFGHSPIPGNANYFGYKVVNPGTSQTIRWLPDFPDAAGSTSLVAPYGCTPDGKYAVGASWRGVERAGLWDTSNPDSAKWTVLDLTDIAAANGILASFSRLSRAYSVGVNAAGDLVITGTGLDTNSAPNTRAFLLTVSPPIAPITHPPAVTATAANPTGLVFSFMTLGNPSITYHLEYTTTVTGTSGWTTFASTPGTGRMVSLYDPDPPDPHRFYRIRVR